jgi:enoyl-CoA hydratase
LDVLYALEGPVAVIRLNRPDQRNAVTTAMMAGLVDAMARFEADPSAQVAILAGEGKVFCAGMDLAAFAAGERPGIDTPEGFAGFVNAPRTKPVIAAVTGGAHAGGFEIVLACDLVVAEEGALFSLPEVKRGLVAAGGGAHRLPRRVPRAVALEMLLTGDAIAAERALALGLVNRVVPRDEVLPAARALAAGIAANAPRAVRETLALARAASRVGEEALWQANAATWARIDGSRDAREGALAFKEKRAPVWSGT